MSTLPTREEIAEILYRACGADLEGRVSYERMADAILARLRPAFERMEQLRQAAFDDADKQGRISCELLHERDALRADLRACAEALERIEHVTDDPDQWDLWRIICQVHSDADAALARPGVQVEMGK